MFGNLVVLKFDLIEVNEDIATFKCNDKISGIFHTVKNGETTVILDGGYVLGVFHCPHCAIEEIRKLYINIYKAEKKNGDYQSHKKSIISSLH